MRFNGLSLAFLCLIFTATSADEIDNLWADYVALLETFDKYGYSDPNLIDELNRNSSITVSADFHCKPSVSPEKPTSVNKLRPGDINVVGALGDSLTAANGAGAKTLIGVAIEYRGLAAPIGGDKDLEKVITIPNVLKNYNADIYGYSTGTGGSKRPNSKLNVAIPGAVADGMPGQAETLVERMRSDPNVDFDNDWKLVTLFIGGNDLCRQCQYPDRFSPENYVTFIEEAIMILSEVPRMFVNVIGIMEVYKVAEVNGFVCDVMHLFLCPCGMNKKDKEVMKEATRKYQDLLEASITSGKFDRDDFAVVFQPFFVDTQIPRHPDGKIDYSFFAPDCFHLSAKGQGAQAIATWNNMFEPVGSKDKYWTPDEDMHCPSEDFPYLYTNKNSKAPEGDESQGDNQQGGDEDDSQDHNDQPQDKPNQGGDNPGDSPQTDNEGGLSGGVVALIVISVVVITGGVALIVLRRVKKPRNPYQQL